MRGRILHWFATVSLVLCVACCALWARSRRRADFIHLTFNRPAAGVFTLVTLESDNGFLACDIITRRGLDGPPLPLWTVQDTLPTTSAFNPTPGASTHALLGLGIQHHGTPAYNWRRIIVPQPIAILLLTALPAWRLVNEYQQRRILARRHQGRCPNCGYDLRATPTRCPECGREPAEIDAAKP